MSVYLNSMEECILQKIELFRTMKNSIDRVKNNVRNAEDLTARVRYEQANKDYQMQVQHSDRSNKVFFNPSSQGPIYNGMNPINNNQSMINPTNNQGGMNHPHYQNMNAINSASNISSIRAQNRMHAHSASSVHYNEAPTYNQYGDEQLLEGLS